MLIDGVAALVRGLSFIALFQAAGAAIFMASFGSRLTTASSFVRTLGFACALAGIVLITVHYALEPARMAGEWAGALDPTLERVVFESSLSAVWLLRAIGLALIAVTIRHQSRPAILLGLIGALLTIASFLLTGHTATHPGRFWLQALLVVHLAVVAFWFGALWPLLVVSRTEAAARAADVVAQFSRVAVWLVPAILIAGGLMTLVLVRRWAVFGEGYGELLLGKIAGFAALLAMAALNKWRYGPALATSAAAGAVFRRSVVVEYVLICAVLLMTAIMTLLFSPEEQ